MTNLHHKFQILLLLSLLLLHTRQGAIAQCTGGTLAGTLSMTNNWQTANNVNGNTYYNFSAVAGNVYYFSFCTAQGNGSSSYDTQISILNSFGNTVPDGFNDDYCGATGVQSYISWLCVNSGTYRVLLNKKPCSPQTNLGNLAYRFLTPVACPSGLGNGVTSVSSLPYSSGSGTTAGGGNEITSANPDLCGNSIFFDAEDKVWIFTPAISGIVTVNLATTANRVSLSLHEGCPLTGNNSICLDVSQGNGNRSVSSCVQQGITYYVIIDSRSNTPSYNYSNLTISAPVNNSGCSVGTTVSVPSLPFTSAGRTTCGKLNDVGSGATISCGNNSYLSGEDEIFVFTPTVSGNISVNITSSGSYTGLFLFRNCPLSGYCAGSGNECIGNTTAATGTKNLCAEVVAGETYYLIVDSWGGCNPYDISISTPASNFPGAVCSNAIPVTMPFTALRENTACMGDDYNNYTTGSCGSLYESGEDKVYVVNASGPQCLSITLSGASTNSIGYQVYQGCPGSNGSVCIANGGGAAGGTLTGTISLPAAGVYYIIIDTWADPMNVIYDLSLVTFGSGILNDLPCNAIAVTLGTTVNGANNCSGGSGEPAAPSCWPAGNTLNTVWYSFTAPASGSVIVRTSAGSLRNTQIAVYNGTCGTTMQQIGCNADAASCGSTSNQLSQVIVNSLTPGNTYYVVVDGAAAQTGSFGLLIQDGAIPLPSAFGQDCPQPLPVCANTFTVGNPGFQSFGNYCDFTGSGTCLLSGERGSAWYEIRIATTGILEFSIVPNDWPGAPSTSSTDYDFALWKTGGDNSVTCSQIASGAVPVRCNYSYLGVTGLYGAVNATAPPAYPGFGAAYQSGLAVNAGDIFLLVVSNYSNSVSGFTINFSAASPVDYGNGGTSAWTGGIDSDWFKAANWGGCAVPDCSTNVAILPSAVNQPVINAPGAAAKSITVATGASLTLQNTVSLNVCGDFIMNGILNAATSSEVKFTGTASQEIRGSLNGTNAFPSLTVDKSGGMVVLYNDADIKQNFTITGSGIFDANGRWLKIAGNFSNSSGTFTPGAGTLEFNGNAPQLYTNSGLLNDVLMNHSGSGLTLLTDMVLGNGGRLSLQNGKIITGNLEVNVLNSTAIAVSPGNATSYVEGFLKRSVPSSLLARVYDFPVGTSSKGYQRLQLNFYNGVDPLLNYLRVNFNTYSSLPGSPGNDAACGRNYSQSALNNGYWSVLPGGSATSPAHVTLFNSAFSNASTSFTVMTSGADASWSIPPISNGACVTPPAAAVLRNGINASFIANEPFNFGTAQGTSALPVQMLSFIAEAGSSDIMLTWLTASETNNRGFEIQRATKNDNWLIIGWVNGQGTTSALNKYKLSDPNVALNVVYYYRLRQVDFDGRETFTKVVAASIKDGGVVVHEVFPNPFRETTTIQYLISRPTVVTLEITDASGRLIRKINQGLQASGRYTIPFSSQTDGSGPGIYVVTLWCDEQPYKFNISAIR